MIVCATIYFPSYWPIPKVASWGLAHINWHGRLKAINELGDQFIFELYPMIILFGSDTECFDKIRENYIANMHEVHFLASIKKLLDAQAEIALASRFILNASSPMFYPEFLNAYYYHIPMDIIGFNELAYKIISIHTLLPADFVQVFANEENYVARKFFT